MTGTISTVPELASDAHLFIVDDDGLVFRESTQEIFALNTAAAFVWCCAEDAMGADAIAARMTRDFGTPFCETRFQVAALLEQWRVLGLLAGADGGVPRSVPEKRVDHHPPPSDMPPWSEPRVFADRRYRLLDTVTAVRFTMPEQETWVHPVLAHLEIPDAGRAHTVVDVVAHGGRHLIYRDGKAEARGDCLDEIAPWVKAAVWRASVDRHDYFLNIHAGVVGAGDRCVLLPGPPGNGKSTLTAALVHAGFAYFSDEVALLEHGSLAVRPMPLSFGVKSTGWDVLLPCFPELPTLAIHHRADGKVLRYVQPPASAMRADPDRARAVSQIIFPRFSPDSVTRIEPLDRVEALRRLMEDCPAIPGRLTVENVADLADWIRNIDCFDLPLSSLDRAVELVRATVGPPRP